ncbi:MAG TPA: hypothetical protein VLA72_00975, partial [Anaerolineales bacterium]|nr:hypothetical protein [Anaerolineales bacterium]
NTARLWNLQPDYLLGTACQIVGRNFTRMEWKQYFPNDEYSKTCEQWLLEPKIATNATAMPDRSTTTVHNESPWGHSYMTHPEFKERVSSRNRPLV